MVNGKLTKSEFIEKVKKTLGEGYTFDNTVYNGKDKEVTLTCKTHGDFKTRPCYIYRSKSGCKKCSRDAAKDRFLKQAREVHKDKYLYHKVDFKNTVTPVEIVCPQHGSFYLQPYEHCRRGKEIGCMGCFQDRNGYTTEIFIQKAKEVHGELYDYSKVVYENDKAHVEIGCRTHGYFHQQPRIHLMGCGCKQCFMERKRSNNEEFIRKAREIHGGRYDYSRVNYKGNKVKVEIVCKNHGVFESKPNSHLTGPTGCPRCKESKGETRIRIFLEKHKLKFIQEYRIKPSRFRYDFYLPDYGTLIEFHGHQHYRPIELFGGEKTFKDYIRRDKAKESLAKKNNFYLVILHYRMMEEEGLEKMLEMCLRFKGHVFDESLTITKGPFRVETS